MSASSAETVRFRFRYNREPTLTGQACLCFRSTRAGLGTTLSGGRRSTRFVVAVVGLGPWPGCAGHASRFGSPSSGRRIGPAVAEASCTRIGNGGRFGMADEGRE
jgi:hypothetical protein